MKRIALLAAFLAATAASAQPARSPEGQIAALFAPWNRPGTPGAVVGVIRDGKVLFTKRYGMADIERGVPMSPSAEFFIGSMSKQFTAFAIHLLAKDGKLSLDDDVHRYLPDVPDFGRKMLSVEAVPERVVQEVLIRASISGSTHCMVARFRKSL